jgi:hypothetical protein
MAFAAPGMAMEVVQKGAMPLAAPAAACTGRHGWSGPEGRYATSPHGRASSNDEKDAGKDRQLAEAPQGLSSVAAQQKPASQATNCCGRS